MVVSTQLATSSSTLGAAVFVGTAAGAADGAGAAGAGGAVMGSCDQRMGSLRRFVSWWLGLAKKQPYVLITVGMVADGR